MAELSEEHKAIFRDAAARRKAKQIESGLIRMFAEIHQVEGFNEIWETWIERWGKSLSMDHLIRAMCVEEASHQNDLRHAKAYRRQRRANRK
jgi:hypothetical protein